MKKIEKGMKNASETLNDNFDELNKANQNLIKTIELKGINGATQSCYATIINNKFITLTFDTKIPINASTTCYKIDTKYAPKINKPFTLGHNSMNTQAVVVLETNGNLTFTNDDDSRNVFGSYSYSI